MSEQPTIELNDERRMPQLGFGTFKIDDDDAAETIHTALDVGYWLIDTAAFYKNERGVGQGIGAWSDIFLTTKIWNDDQGHERTLAATSESLDRLGREYVDLLLIHWPCPKQNLYVDSWRALIELREQGRAKSIGVANFLPEHLHRIIDETGVTPAVNQIELHPAFQQRELRVVHDRLGIATQSWSPLGQGRGMDDPVIAEISEATGGSAAQVILRWHLQHGLSPIPKASSREHMADNFGALDFTLNDAQMTRIDALDDPAGRIGPDPAQLG